MNNKSILIHAWSIHYDGLSHYLPYTHWVYLNEIVNYYNKVSLLSPVISNSNASKESLVSIKDFHNVSVVPLPASTSYVNTIKHFLSYLKIYRRLTNYHTAYARYPVPFGWLQKLFLKDSNRIIHFVGDPIDAAKNNPNFSVLKKTLLTTFFRPEHSMYLWACKGAKVYTNGYHLAERLEKQGISAIPLISSTLNEDDFFFNDNKVIDSQKPKLLYLGYLRKAKGVETVINAYKKLKEKCPNASLTIVGSGEFEVQLKKIVSDYKLTNVRFLGHVDNRLKLNEIIRDHDIFCFASLSEGSPRVILEAMANGINVVSTPVGSLPRVFKDDVEILFADFNDENQFFEKISRLLNDRELTNSLRLNAFNKVKNFTIESFIKKIFYEA
ncbi:glycosyltransferase family 4 protein [Aequorivita lipolytica]|uniref:Glycosyltransferase family 4 protein n=1 Tax=Aequorivita lipolytica TaxID=153267 RepID=A0A5C6YLW5_9FLAO|nr:glycosyltransferase family 4 protein [Aequorivita lipolytica]TXD67863.1 glycosyltransferase family 4 protein [Aequorivita lipolytica]SRX51199.1 Phosphatidyl-myo-inositol mannosyltransferase [Aequorivita lipolytica]